MPRRERVRRTPERRDEQREQDDPRREVAALDQRLEAAATVGGSRRGVERRGRRRSAAGCEVRVRRADVERRAEQVARVGPSSSERLSPGTDASTSRAPSRAETVISRQPIRVAKARSVNDSDPPVARCVDDLESERLQAPAPSRGETRRLSGRSATRRPSRRSSRLFATVVAKPGARTSSPNWKVGISARSRT